MHPCIECGACCLCYRVTFHWSETLAESHHVPSELTVDSAFSPHQASMRGTDPVARRCAALKGKPGKAVHCSIYDRRPSPCRNFKASLEDGVHQPRCDEARAKAGLRALEPGDWGWSRPPQLPDPIDRSV